MPRAFLIVLDSAGCGGAPDAAAFGDEGANTLAHVAAECAAGRAGEGRDGPLRLPTMDRMGLGRAIALASGARAPNLGAEPDGPWAAATSASTGKDTQSGHWELAGLPVDWDWRRFPDEVPCFPGDLARRVAELAGTGGILGNRHASGTAILDEEGEAHLSTGWPICYTSADSVFQVAAHEERFGLDRLLALCRALAPVLHAMDVGRVIARPFTGAPGAFRRTGNRRDFGVAPPRPTLCDRVREAGGRVHGVGKIGDIFAMRGIDESRTGPDAELAGHLRDLARGAPDGSLTFANFVEFDSLYGHRRDVSGYARHLEWFDGALAGILPLLGPGDLAVVTADHGNDPTWPGTDHTRERVPVLQRGAGAAALRGLVAFSDVAGCVAAHLGLPGRHGPSPGEAV